MLINLVEILKLAEEKGVAVGVLNTSNLERITSVCNATENWKCP